jgi:outer membrane biosynthesis protein TonB
MAERDSQPIVLSRQAILLVTAVGVGLLTLCYVLGVQVGKQSAALRQPMAKGSGEELEDLPASLDQQMKNLEGLELEKTQKQPVPSQKPASPAKSKPEATEQETPASPGKTEHSEPKPKSEAETKKDVPQPEKSTSVEHWTAQLLSTTDASEATRMAARAKAAGFAATTVKEKGTIKVRLTHSGKRAEVDATVSKLKAKGLHAFPIKID